MVSEGMKIRSVRLGKVSVIIEVGRSNQRKSRSSGKRRSVESK